MKHTRTQRRRERRARRWWYQRILLDMPRLVPSTWIASDFLKMAGAHSVALARLP